MAEIRGNLLNEWIGPFKGKYGREQIEKVGLDLDPADRALASKIILDSNWYPLDLMYAFHVLSRRLAGPEKPVLPDVIGRAMAERAYGGVYRRLPAKQVEKLSYTPSSFSVIRGVSRPRSTAEGPAISDIHTRSGKPILELFASLCWVLDGHD